MAKKLPRARFGVAKPGFVYLRVVYLNKYNPETDTWYKDPASRRYEAPSVPGSSIGFSRPVARGDGDECVMYNPDDLPRSDMTDQEAYEWYEAYSIRMMDLANEYRAKASK